MGANNSQATGTNEHPTNQTLADALRQVADLLETQGANPFRVRAYRAAAETVQSLPAPLWQTVKAEGAGALTRFPGIGRSIAGALAQMVTTGKFQLLSRLRGDDRPEHLFATVANIGPKLAKRIHESLEIETLAELEAAALDGRLAQVPGMGRKRLRAVRESLAGRFRRTRLVLPTHTSEETSEGPLEELLDVDRQYRELASQQKLPRIAPQRFNPTRQAWLPILHTERGPRHYTAMFSNTARAHELGMTNDWVVIYRDDDGDHGQWTVITSNFGKLRGKRIVRGREAECQRLYDAQQARPRMVQLTLNGPDPAIPSGATR